MSNRAYAYIHALHIVTTCANSVSKFRDSITEMLVMPICTSKIDFTDHNYKFNWSTLEHVTKFITCSNEGYINLLSLEANVSVLKVEIWTSNDILCRG